MYAARYSQSGHLRSALTKMISWDHMTNVDRSRESGTEPLRVLEVLDHVEKKPSRMLPNPVACMNELFTEWGTRSPGPVEVVP